MPKKLISFGMALALICANPVSAQVDWPALRFTEVLSGVQNPTAITHAGDGSGRLFIAERTGRVRVVVNNELEATPFLDISGRVSSWGEGGLLSLVFPPGFGGEFWSNSDRNKWNAFESTGLQPGSPAQ